MKITVITDSSIYNPTAGVNRCVSLAKGLVAAGHDVDIFCLDACSAGSATGDLGGVQFRHAASGIPSQNRWRRGWTVCVQYLGELNRFVKNTPTDAALVMVGKPWRVFLILQVLARREIPGFTERNEYPFILAPQIDTFLQRQAVQWWYIKKMVPRMCGLALMTKNLETYFRQVTPRCPPTIVIPMTVEPERFETPGMSPFPFRYIGFCGVLTGTKDGVPILVEAFGRIAAQFPDIRLVIIGDNSDTKAINDLRAIAEQYGAADRILFTGMISRKEMPRYLGNAALLALSRPRTKQAEGGFPTKLGEYLATGRPTVVTRVGEIPDYLEDGVHSFLAEPDDVDDFARALRTALSDPAGAEQVGTCGRTLAHTVFDYRVQGKRLGNFMSGTMQTPPLYT